MYLLQKYVVVIVYIFPCMRYKNTFEWHNYNEKYLFQGRF